MAFDKAARTITISDNGIGMSREEVIENIGTIAKSGTREFFEQPDRRPGQGREPDRPVRRGLLFLVHRRRQGHAGHPPRRAGRGARRALGVDGQGEYTIETVEKAGRGTDVTLHLREGEDELLDGYRLRSIIRKYSDHITLPILMKKEEWDKDKDENVAQGRGRDGQPGQRLWARPKSEITDEQYHEFYKHVAHDFEPPLAWTHAKVEGKPEYTSCSTSRRARRSTCGTASTATASSSTCGACSSWTTPSSCCRPTCASCAA